MGRKESKFKISTEARDLLMKDTELSALVGERIYPCVAPEDTTDDYIIYFRDEYRIDDTKMGIYKQEATVAIVVISNDYDRSQDIAEKVFNVLQGRHGNTIYNLADSTEDYKDKKYYQFLIFKIT